MGEYFNESYEFSLSQFGGVLVSFLRKRERVFSREYDRDIGSIDKGDILFFFSFLFSIFSPPLSSRLLKFLLRALFGTLCFLRFLLFFFFPSFPTSLFLSFVARHSAAALLVFGFLSSIFTHPFLGPLLSVLLFMNNVGLDYWCERASEIIWATLLSTF